MKKVFLFVVAALSAFVVCGQQTGHLRYDSVKIYRVGGNGELIIENATKDTTGLLYNYYKGRTRFIKPKAVPGGIAFGNDTVAVAGGSGNDNFNEAAGFRLLIPSTQGVKTLFSGTNVTIDSTTNPGGLTISASGGGGTDNNNVATGFRLVKPATQEVKTLYGLVGASLDSTTNADGITIMTYDSLHIVGVKNVADLRSIRYDIKGSNYRQKSGNDKIFIELLGYYNPGDGGGGRFYWDDTATVADNGGTILKPTDAGTGRWKRVHNQKEVNILWFGAKADGLTTSGALNRAAFDAAKNSLPVTSFSAVIKSKGVLYIPGGSYFFDSTLVVNGSMTIKGDEGTNGYQSTQLNFYNNYTGMMVTPADASDGRIGGGVRISHIAFLSYYQNINDTTIHGLKIRSTTDVSYCSFQNFPGDGINIFADASELSFGQDGFGNAAFSKIYNCRFYANNNGVRIRGGDANVVTTELNDFTANRRWGRLDDSFLQTVSIQDAFHDNTYQTGNKTQVEHNGDYYICIVSNTGIEPGVTSGWQNYYVDAGDPFNTYFNTWNVDSTYYSGGAYSSYPGYNANSVFIAPYVEGGQPVMHGLRTMVLNGDDAAALFPQLGGLGDNRLTMVSGAYTFLTNAQYSRSDKNTRSLLSSEGLAVAPNENFPGQQYWLKLQYDSTNKKYQEIYDNFGNTSRRITTYTTLAADYGLSSPLAGMTEFPRGAYFGVYGNSDFRRFQFASAVPASGEWAKGDVVLREITAAGQSLGWRCTVGGTPGTWEEIAWPGTSIDEHFANANLTATADRTHDFNDFSLSINDLRELEFNSTVNGTRYTTLKDLKPFYEGFSIQSVFDPQNQGSLSVYNANNASGLYMDASGNSGAYTAIDIAPDSLKINPDEGIINIDTLATVHGSDTANYLPTVHHRTTGQFKKMTYWPATGGGGGSVKLNSIIAADGNNTINNGSTFHNWQWNSLASNYGLNFSTTSASQSGSRMLDITMAGTSSGTSSGIWIRNQNGGTGHNIGLEIDNAGGDLNSGILVDVNGNGVTTATGLNVNVASATNNYAIIVPSGGGNTGLGTSTPSTTLHVNGVNSLRYVDGNQALNKVLTSDGNGVASWQTPTTGSGTVNSGTQYQMAFYAANGTAVSGNTGITTNANNRLMVSSSDDEPFQVTTTGTGIASQYFPVASFLAPNMGGGDFAQFSFGKANSTNDKMFFNYVHTADGSANNYMNIEGYGASTPAMKITAGNLVGINISSAPLYNLHVNGTSAFNEHSIFRKTISMGETGFTGAAQFYGTTSGIVTLSVNDIAGTWTMKLPNAAPVSNGLVMTGNIDGTTSWSAAGAGDVTSNTATSVNDEIALFNGTTGKQIKRASGTGFIKASSGVATYQGTISLSTEVNGILPATNGGTGKNTIGSAGQMMKVNSGGTAYEDFTLIQAKSASIQAPTTSENVTLFYTTQAITITEVRGVMLGTTPSVTFQINYGDTRDVADGQVVSSIQFDSGETGYQTTGFAFTVATSAIPAGNYIWITTSANGGTVNELNLNVSYRQ